MELKFKEAEVSDVEAIVALVNRAYRGPEARKTWTNEAAMLDGQRTDDESVRALIAQHDSTFLLAYDAFDSDRSGREVSKRHLVACVQLEFLDQKTCYLGMLTVDPAIQGAGIGRRVLNSAEIFVQKTRPEIKKIEMTVITVREELVAWYERRGYWRTGIYKPFPYGDERFGIPLVENLQFEVLEKNLNFE
jgi:ribosomal protein S18 acetylase RimI-like enzyme